MILYQAFIYGILYLLFEAYPISFYQEREWELGLSSLPFLGLLVGELVGFAILIHNTLTVFARETKAAGGKVVPELRLPTMILGGMILPVGFFWLAWTSEPGVPWEAQVFAGIPIGAGMYLTFIQSFNYIIDVYLTKANSAISAATFVRSAFGAGFPLFAPAMFHNLGVNWAASVLGVISVVMVPIPIAFYLFGPKLRALSRARP
jgi:DHA1 family multidrug resistance protein-like MFS transporter